MQGPRTRGGHPHRTRRRRHLYRQWRGGEDGYKLVTFCGIDCRVPGWINSVLSVVILDVSMAAVLDDYDCEGSELTGQAFPFL